MGDDHLFKVRGISTVHIKIFDGMIWELKKVKYVTPVKNNLLCWSLEALGHGVSVRDGVLKMTRASMVVLKGI